MDHVVMTVGSSFREVVESFPAVAVVMKDLIDRCKAGPIEGKVPNEHLVVSSNLIYACFQMILE